MRYRFGGHLLDVDRRELRRGSELVEIEPQVFDLLAYLLRNHDRVVGKDELLDAVWAGRIVSDSTLASRLNAARRAIGDTGAEKRLLRTYPRKGVRFLGEVAVESATEGAGGEAHAASSMVASSRGKPCIAVLPLLNLSGEPDQDYFADGITEDIITELSRNRALNVIARNSSFVFRGGAADVKRVGRELGADYAVEGSVRRLAGNIRVTVQLSETDTGRQLWAERYDRGLQEIFQVQDEITATIAARIDPEVGIAEQQRVARKPAHALEAWDLFRLGTRAFYKPTADDNREAQRLFRCAIDRDPELAPAYGFLSYAIVLSMIYFDAEPNAARVAEAVAIAHKAMELDDRDAMIRFIYGRALIAQGMYEDALAELQYARDLNPSLPVVHCGLGDSLAYAGRISDAIPHFQAAIDLSPHDPLRWAFLSYRALAHIFGGQYEEAAQWAYQATRVPNCHYWGFAHRVAALGHLPYRDEQLQQARTELLRVNPQFSQATARRRLFYVKDPAQIDKYVIGLSQAGLPIE